jgi:hypothetical protein
LHLYRLGIKCGDCNNVYVCREPLDVIDNGEGGEIGDYDDLAMNNMRRRRRRRETQLNTSSITIADDGHQLYNMTEDDNDTSPVPPAEYEKIMKTVVYGALQANISGLDHFQDYIIEVCVGAVLSASLYISL